MSYGRSPTGRHVSSRCPFPRFKGKYPPLDYQHVAIKKTLDVITAKQDRILLTMATGTGKLRELWSQPSTRKKLLETLSENGYTAPQLEDLSKLVHGENSDLFDVLNYVAYHKDLVPRLDRAEQAQIQLHDYAPKQQAFLNFVLSQYVKEGVDELDDTKLSDLLVLNYGAIADAKTQLGAIKSIRETFIGFQRLLYQDSVA